ncbi:hypothetical protein [Rhizobium leguminosarum]|uniref:hypothetical protein n=1 Tax=Rhizobium leguminosarum TaxID=384 RepID=UPI0012F64FD9|nr:hypothetical protein [Rhizobium leguminosarum]
MIEMKQDLASLAADLAIQTARQLSGLRQRGISLHVNAWFERNAGTADVAFHSGLRR